MQPLSSLDLIKAGATQTETPLQKQYVAGERVDLLDELTSHLSVSGQLRQSCVGEEWEDKRVTHPWDFKGVRAMCQTLFWYRCGFLPSSSLSLRFSSRWCQRSSFWLRRTITITARPAIRSIWAHAVRPRAVSFLQPDAVLQAATTSTRTRWPTTTWSTLSSLPCQLDG